MERGSVVKVSTENGEIRWKKIGGGALIINNHHIKPGQIFKAREDQIPLAFRDVVKNIDPLKGQKKTKAVKVKFEVIPAEDVEDNELYYVINSNTGKKMNATNPFTLDVANRFIEDMAEE